MRDACIPALVFWPLPWSSPDVPGAIAVTPSRSGRRERMAPDTALRDVPPRNAELYALGVRPPLAPRLLLSASNDTRIEGATMRIVTTSLAVLGLISASTAYAAECEPSCQLECRQEASICHGTATLEAKAGKAACDADATDAQLECEAGRLEARELCVGLCGEELKQCVDGAKATAKRCRELAKSALETCRSETAGEADEQHASCSEDAADCVESCAE
jgi:hypothetical protein